jgi:hypothetical protein
MKTSIFVSPRKSNGSCILSLIKGMVTKKTAMRWQRLAGLTVLAVTFACANVSGAELMSWILLKLL